MFLFRAKESTGWTFSTMKGCFCVWNTPCCCRLVESLLDPFLSGLYLSTSWWLSKTVEELNHFRPHHAHHAHHLQSCPTMSHIVTLVPRIKHLGRVVSSHIVDLNKRMRKHTWQGLEIFWGMVMCHPSSSVTGSWTSNLTNGRFSSRILHGFARFEKLTGITAGHGITMNYCRSAGGKQR